MQAYRLHAFWKAALQHDARIKELLERFRGALDASYQVMRACGLQEICKRCETLEGGSCCGAGIEYHYTSIQLLINLLLDTAVPSSRLYDDSCFFLGEEGCTLKARHVICVNYLCGKLNRLLSPSAIKKIQETVGEELQVGFELYEAVKAAVGHWS